MNSLKWDLDHQKSKKSLVRFWWFASPSCIPLSRFNLHPEMCASMSVLGAGSLSGYRLKPQVQRSHVCSASANRKLWAPGVEAPSYLDGSLPGDYGLDPMGLSADPKAMAWYRQAELVHGRWAMMGTAGILGQELLNPDVFWYEAGLPQNLPDNVSGFNLGGILAFEFCMMHFVEVRRWQDFRNPGSVNDDPVFKGNSVPNEVMGYPGGIFDPFGFSKGKDLESLKTKEIKNGRLAMFAWTGFAIQAQATGKGPIACLKDHLADPLVNNIGANIGTCTIPDSVDVGGVTIPLYCLWPGQ